MPGLKDRLASRLTRLRERHPAIGHTIDAVTHYGGVNGNGQAGAVTFFGFLSFFPILALAFFVVGWVSEVFPELRVEVVRTLESLLPGMIGYGEGQVPLDTFTKYAGRVGLLGVVGLLYSGLGWLSGMRSALAVLFVLPEKEHPGFVTGKLRDLLALVLIGLVLLLSIALSGAMTWSSESILDVVGLGDSIAAAVLLWILAHGLAVGATTVLLVTMFRQLSHPRVPARALWQGALVGAVGFELLKSAAGLLIAQTKGQPAFQAFGVALILLVWINYFSRLVLLSAAWAHTSRTGAELRSVAERPFADDEELEALEPAPAAVVGEDPAGSPLPRDRVRRTSDGLGGAALPVAGATGAVVGAAAALAFVRRRRR